MFLIHKVIILSDTIYTGMLYCYLFILGFATKNPTNVSFESESPGDVTGLSEPYRQMAIYVVGASLTVSSIVVVYHIIENTGKGKKAIVSWLIALLIFILLLT